LRAAVGVASNLALASVLWRANPMSAVYTRFMPRERKPTTPHSVVMHRGTQPCGYPLRVHPASDRGPRLLRGRPSGAAKHAASLARPGRSPGPGTPRSLQLPHSGELPDSCQVPLSRTRSVPAAKAQRHTPRSTGNTCRSFAETVSYFLRLYVQPCERGRLPVPARLQSLELMEGLVHLAGEVRLIAAYPLQVGLI
jgi:hypothetical protein